jgi:hypothetical protein
MVPFKGRHERRTGHDSGEAGCQAQGFVPPALLVLGAVSLAGLKSVLIDHTLAG